MISTKPAVRSSLATIVAAVLGSLGGCESESVAEPRPVASKPAAVAEPAAQADSKRSAGNPLKGAQTPTEEESLFTGIVAQRVEAGGYTYLEVDAGDFKRWVATMGPGQPKGERVTVRAMAVTENFHSGRLDRDFDRLVFGVVEVKDKT